MKIGKTEPIHSAIGPDRAVASFHESARSREGGVPPPPTFSSILGGGGTGGTPPSQRCDGRTSRLLLLLDQFRQSDVNVLASAGLMAMDRDGIASRPERRPPRSR